MSCITNSLCCYQNTAQTTNSYASSEYSSDKKLVVKTALVAISSMTIDKFVFGENTSNSLTFGVYAGVSSALSDKISGYVPQLFDLSQANSFERVLTNTNLLSIAGGAGLSVFLYNKPYSRISQTNQVFTVIFSEVLANFIMEKYVC